MLDAATSDDGTTIAVPIDLDGSGKIGISFEEAQSLEGAEVIVHGGRGGQSDGFTDFPHRGWETSFFHVGLDAFENAALTIGQSVFAHVVIVRVFVPGVKHLFVFFQMRW